ncbi:MAG: outer membrane protein assembly factor BamD [Candidatus Zixiibacteriota bacterium]|nr:MAG: outer membrane protein assembly factor BamD [candidate division Zixibacteria bacterium]
MKQTAITAILLLLLISVLCSFVGCGKRPVLTNLSAQELFERGKEEYNNKKYLRALEYFQAVVYNYPGESIIDTAQYYLGLAYFGAKEYELAQVEFNRLILNYPSSVYFQHAMFMKAVSFYEGTPHHYGLDQTDLQTSISQFEDFIIDYPESELLPQANEYLNRARTRMAKKSYNSAVVYHRMGAYESAEIYYQKVIDDYTDTEFAPMATYYIAEMAYKQRRYEEARQGFEGFMTVFPDHELTEKAKERAPKAAFKSGESAYKQGEYGLAVERLENYIQTYPNHDKVNDARVLLGRIRQPAPAEVTEENANS